MRVIVYHSSYGCDTGCCGHVIELIDDENNPLEVPTEEKWTFDHPYLHGETDEQLLEWVKRIVHETLGPEHVADLDWENCVISDD